MASTGRPIFAPSVPAATVGGTTVRISSRQTDGAFCVCETTTMPGDGVPWHVHDRDEELYYILEGTLDLEAGDDRLTAGPGSLVVIPPHLPHGFWNAGSSPVRALMIFRPGGFDEMIGELEQAATSEESQDKRDAILFKWGVVRLDDAS